MGAFLVYILKSAVCIILFYLFYKLLLSRETFHRINRIVLLGVMLLSFVLPLVEVSVNAPTEVHEAIQTIDEFFVPYEGEAPSLSDTPLEPGDRQESMNGVQILLATYLIGSVLFALYTLWSLIRLGLLLKSCRRKRLEDYFPDGSGASLWLHDKKCSPFGWMNCIVIREKDLEENGREILIHEMAHIRNRHSLDLLVAEVCIFFQWFNPAAWLLKKELQTIHEYEADETVINEGVNAKQYQLLLIKKAVGNRLYSMANSLNQNQLKKRITMMQKEKSKDWARWKCIFVLPLAAVAIGVFARPEVSAKADELSAVSAKELITVVENKVSGLTVPVPSDTVKAASRKERNKEAQLQLLTFGTLRTMIEELKDSIAQISAQIVKKDNHPIEAKPIVGFTVPKRESNQAIGAMQSKGTSYSVDGVKVSKQELYKIVTKDIAAIDVKQSEENGTHEMAVITRSKVGQTLTPATDVPVADEPDVVKEPAERDIIFHHLTKPISYTTQAERENLIGRDIYTETDRAPQFPGGEAAYQQFHKENARFTSVKNDMELDYPYVLLEFIVWKDGSISNISVHQAYRKSWADEAVRFLKSMPKWIPAQVDGDPVDARIYYPILVMPQEDFRLLMIERDYRHNVKPRRQLSNANN